MRTLENGCDYTYVMSIGTEIASYECMMKKNAKICALLEGKRHEK